MILNKNQLLTSIFKASGDCEKSKLSESNSGCSGLSDLAGARLLFSRFSFCALFYSLFWFFSCFSILLLIDWFLEPCFVAESVDVGILPPVWTCAGILEVLIFFVDGRTGLFLVAAGCWFAFPFFSFEFELCRDRFLDPKLNRASSAGLMREMLDWVEVICFLAAAAAFLLGTLDAMISSWKPSFCGVFMVASCTSGGSVTKESRRILGLSVSCIWSSLSKGPAPAPRRPPAAWSSISRMSIFWQAYCSFTANFDLCPASPVAWTCFFEALLFNFWFWSLVCSGSLPWLFDYWEIL